jgi:hypothetical protein
LNNALRNQTVAEEKKKRLPANSASKKTVLDFIKSYRAVPQFANLIVGEKGKDKNWKPSYDAQTDAILGQIKNVPFIMENLKALAAAAPDSDDDNEE